MKFNKHFWNIKISIWIFILWNNVVFTSENKNESWACASLVQTWHSKGFDRNQVPKYSIPDEHLQVCLRTGSTCCTRSMEMKLVNSAKSDHSKIIDTKLDQLRQNFILYTTKFDGFCLQLINQSAANLHDMFYKTYGLLYQQNSNIFSELFEQLLAYFHGHDINLSDVFDTFFSSLMQRMFVLLNAQYNFDPKYLSCVTDRIEDLKPFRNAPNTLKIQVKKALVAARTFSQGLLLGRDFLLTLSKVEISTHCVDAVTRMTMCQMCHAHTHMKPCNTFCLNVMKGCLAQFFELNESWNQYQEQLGKVGDRLAGSFNFEGIIDSINVKISEAIMNFQEDAEIVTSKVYTGCGHPKYEGRIKRQVSAISSHSMQNRQILNTPEPPLTMQSLMNEIKDKICDASDLFKDLPEMVCNHLSNMNSTANCWNGSKKAKYMNELAGQGVLSLSSNPEFKSNTNKLSPLMEQQMIHLKTMTMKLKNSYNGIDVDRFDGENGMDEMSGSGDGISNGREDKIDSGSGENSFYNPPIHEYFPDRTTVIHYRLPSRTYGDVYHKFTTSQRVYIHVTVPTSHGFLLNPQSSTLFIFLLVFCEQICWYYYHF